MCGIAGYVDLDGGPGDEATVVRMTDLLSHRGPDHSRAAVLSAGPGAPTAVLGYRRLAIIDLTDAATQPLSNEDGSVAVVYNGEIYNFHEVRRDLEARGHVFRSRGDTEVIVHAYEEYGDEFVARLDGMFAFALWDGTRGRLVLARDRAGKKPLYYAWDGRRLTFASEIKALRVASWVDDEVDWSRVPELLALGYVAWPRTMHRGILQVPPAASMALDDRGLSEPRTYWEVPFGARPARPIGWDEAAGRVRDRLRDAVERRLVSDVPLGVLLSGGLDSSALVALMAGLGAPVRTFTVGFGEQASFDERRFARLVSRQFETEHVEAVVSVEAADLLESLLWYLDQPLADSSAVPTYLISGAAREHVTVALTGDGGDEVFGGYERFAAALLADRLPRSLQRSVGAVARLVPRTQGYYALRRRLDRFAGGHDRPVEDRYASWVSVFDREALGGVLSPDVGSEDAFESFTETYGQTLPGPLLERLLHANFRTYLHDDLLVKTDRMSMANSLEARSPFLDTALVEEVAALPPEMKASPFGLKRVLRRALRGLLPREIVSRRKHGFGVPVGRWFRRELREPFVELVLSSDARSGPILHRQGVEALLAEHTNGTADHGARLWSLLALEIWLRGLERPPEEGPSTRSGMLDARGRG